MAICDGSFTIPDNSRYSQDMHSLISESLCVFGGKLCVCKCLLNVIAALISQDTCLNLIQKEDRTSTKYLTLPLKWLEESVPFQICM